MSKNSIHKKHTSDLKGNQFGHLQTNTLIAAPMSMRLALTLLLPVVTGFVLQTTKAPLPAAARTATPVMYKPNLRVSGINVDITDAMAEIAEKKLAAPLEKFASVLNDAKGAEVHMSVERTFVHDTKKKSRARETHVAEVTAHLKGSHRTVVARSESEDNLYMAVDSLEALLSRKLRKAKDQWADKGKKKRGQKSKGDIAAGSFEGDDAEDE